MRYIGVKYSDGKVFDSNYDAATPMGISLQGVIEGWTQGLKGKKVGSRVELIIPADLAYGNDAGGSKPSGTLVFVVDILGAEENPQTLQRAQAASSAAAQQASASATASRPQPGSYRFGYRAVARYPRFTSHFYTALAAYMA